MNIVVLGGSYLQSGFIETAREMCDEVYVLDRDKNCYARRIDDIAFHEIDISDEKQVFQFFQEKKCDLIVSPATEIGNWVAAKIAKRCGLYYNSLDAVKATTDKRIMRDRLKKSGLKGPRSETFTSISQTIRNFSYPFIVKPPNSSASRGVTLVEKEDDLAPAIEEALKFCQDKSEILIEEFIFGDQFSIETISSFGEHHIVGITREYISGAPNCLERTHVISKENTAKYCSSFQEYIEQLLNTLGVKVGPCHIEVKLRDGEIYLIEAASRSGGWRDRLLKASNSSDYNELIIKAYSGDKIGNQDLQKPENDALLGIIMTPDDLNVYLRAKKEGLIIEENFNGKGPVNDPKRLTDAFGYYFIAGGREIMNYRLV